MKRGVGLCVCECVSVCVYVCVCVVVVCTTQQQAMQAGFKALKRRAAVTEVRARDAGRHA